MLIRGLHPWLPITLPRAHTGGCFERPSYPRLARDPEMEGRPKRGAGTCSGSAWGTDSARRSACSTLGCIGSKTNVTTGLTKSDESGIPMCVEALHTPPSPPHSLPPHTSSCKRPDTLSPTPAILSITSRVSRGHHARLPATSVCRCTRTRQPHPLRPRAAAGTAGQVWP